METIINYFRNVLRNKLTRALCGRFLPLWDDEKWIKRPTDINLDYIEANDFLIFLCQTKTDTCCHDNVYALALSNVIDKFFFLMFDFQSYFNSLIIAKYYNTRVEIISDIIKYKENNVLPSKLIPVTKHLELFVDLSKKINEWDYWRRQIIVNFVKINLGNIIYQSVQENDAENLRKLIENVQQLFFNGLNY